LLGDLQALVAEETAFDPSASERIVRLSGSDVSSHELLPPLCGLLTACGSLMRVSWKLADHERLPERLRKGDVDLGLLPRLTPVAGLESTLLFEDDYVIVHGIPDHGAAFSIEEFCERRHITLAQTRTTLDDAIDQHLARLGCRRHVQVAVTTFGQMADVIERTETIAVFPRRAARRFAPRLAWSPLPFELPTYKLHLCWDGRSESDRAVMWLRDRVIEISARGHPG
jgi:DNA-binding transcriptional LysR family regulator